MVANTYSNIFTPRKVSATNMQGSLTLTENAGIWLKGWICNQLKAVLDNSVIMHESDQSSPNGNETIGS